MTIDWTNSGTATVLQTLNLIFVLAWAPASGLHERADVVQGAGVEGQQIAQIKTL